MFIYDNHVVVSYSRSFFSLNLIGITNRGKYGLQIGAGQGITNRGNMDYKSGQVKRLQIGAKGLQNGAEITNRGKRITNRGR